MVYPMSASALEHQELTCPHCGGSYRLPRWGRKYACGACGCPLVGARPPSLVPRSRASIPRWVSYLTVAGILAVATVAYGALQAPKQQRLGRADRRFPSTRRAFRPYYPAPDFSSRLRKKLHYLQEDYAKYPSNQSLPVHLAECYLLLAVARREAAPIEAAQYVSAARLAIQKRNVMPPAIPIFRVLDEWEKLRWSEPGSGVLAAFFFPESLRSAGGPMYAGYPMSVGSNPWARFGSFPGSSVSAEGRVEGDEASSGSESAPSRPTQVSPRPGFAESNGRGGLPYIPPPPDIATALPPAELRRQIQQLSTQFKRNPDQRLLAYRLAFLLEMEAGIRAQIALRNGATDGSEASKGDFSQALAIYRSLAARPAPRRDRAGALLFAAALSGKQNNWKQQFQYLKKAVEITPYEPFVWSELNRAAMRAGNLAESRRARVEAERWRFPDLRSS